LRVDFFKPELCSLHPNYRRKQSVL